MHLLWLFLPLFSFFLCRYCFSRNQTMHLLWLFFFSFFFYVFMASVGTKLKNAFHFSVSFSIQLYLFYGRNRTKCIFFLWLFLNSFSFSFAVDGKIWNGCGLVRRSRSWHLSQILKSYKTTKAEFLFVTFRSIFSIWCLFLHLIFPGSLFPFLLPYSPSFLWVCFYSLSQRLVISLFAQSSFTFPW